MNGVASRQGDAFGPGRLGPAQPIGPNGKILMEGYKKEVFGSFEKERTRYNPTNGDRPERSPLVDLDDPIQVHLLTETALSDSRKYQILSQEEVDSIKKQVQSLTMRIEQARANLAIQSKYRDAAISMTKLYSPGKAEKRRSLITSNRLSDQAKEAEMERQISEKRCEELATELFSLEKCLMEPQRQLLEHTCAILQLTHKASSRKGGQPPLGQPMTNGIPGSPESLYTYSNARNSLEPPSDDMFDDRSLYLPLDQMDSQTTRPRKNTIEIPMKSPVREQNQLRGEMDRMKEENMQLREAEQQLSAVTTDQQRVISDTERKLEVLNKRLRDVVITFNPGENAAFPEPGPATGSGDSLTRQLEYLEMGLSAASEEQKYTASDSLKEAESAARAAAATASLVQADERVQELNRQVEDMLLKSDLEAPPPEESASIEAKLDYLGNSLQMIQTELSRAAQVSSSASANKQNSDQVETVLTGLWDIIQSGYAEIQQQKAARRQNRTQMGLPPDEDDMSGDESVDPNESYSLQAFSAKVQWLYAQATSLKEQKSVLKRQIKQQRELNNKSDAEKDREVQAKTEEVDKMKVLLDDSETAAREAREKLTEALNNLDVLQKASEENQSTSARAVQEQIKERNAKIAALEGETREREALISGLESQTQERDATIAALESQSQERIIKIAELESEFQEKNSKIATLEAQFQERNAQIATLEATAQEQNGTIIALESTLQGWQSQLEAAEANLESIQAKLSQADEARATAEASLDELSKSLKDKDEELERMNMMIIELKTEVTIAKAELDGAYGSRRQRAAEAAALSKSSETEELNQQVARLKAELESTLRDFEEMTKESIAAEKDKLDLESQLDDALGVRQGLENEVKALRQRLDREVGSLKEELDKERLRVPPSPGPGGPGGGAGATRAGATMLSEQFRATMKEERKKFQEELREEQAKRRKLEDEIRLLKKTTPGAGIGRSPLGPLSPTARG